MDLETPDVSTQILEAVKVETTLKRWVSSPVSRYQPQLYGGGEGKDTRKKERKKKGV